MGAGARTAVSFVTGTTVTPRASAGAEIGASVVVGFATGATAYINAAAVFSTATGKTTEITAVVKSVRA